MGTFHTSLIPHQVITAYASSKVLAILPSLGKPGLRGRVTQAAVLAHSIHFSCYKDWRRFHCAWNAIARMHYELPGSYRNILPSAGCVTLAYPTTLRMHLLNAISRAAPAPSSPLASEVVTKQERQLLTGCASSRISPTLAMLAA